MPRPARKGGEQLGILEEGHHSPFLRGKKVFLLCSLESKQSVIFGTINKCWHCRGGAGKGHGRGGGIPRDEPHAGIPTGSPVGAKTCLCWVWALHSTLPVPTPTRCASCVAQTDGGLCSSFWDAHLRPKGSTQEAKDLQPEVLQEELEKCSSSCASAAGGCGEALGEQCRVQC